MDERPFHLIVEIPSIEDFAGKYRQYAPFAQNGGRFLFDLLMSPESYVAAQVATLNLELPAVAGVAKACREACDRRPDVEWRGFIKQYIGALVCSLMEANGFVKTGTKRAIPHHDFTKGEVYRLQTG